MSAAKRGLGYGLRALRAYVLFVICATAAALGAAYPLAALRLRAARAGWERSFGPVSEWRARFPPHGNSPAALELDRLARPLEVQIVRTAEDRERDLGSGGGKSARYELLQEAGRYVTSQEWTPEERIDPPPREVAAFLAERDASLASVEDLLLAGQTLAWEQDVDLGQASPLPSLVGHRHLANLLLARALGAIRAGRWPDAERTLRAGWVHAVSLQADPQVISKLITVALVQMNAGVLRRLPRPSPDWPEKIPEGEIRRSLLDAYRFEAYSYEVFGGRYVGASDLDTIGGGDLGPSTPGDRVLRLLTVPWVRFCIAGFSEEMRRQTEELRDQDPCAFDGEKVEARVQQRVQRWNIIGRMVPPSLLRTWQSAVETDLRLEQIGLVLAARRRGRGDDDLQPASSHVCAQLRWTRRRDASGRMVIAPDPVPFAGPKARDWTIRLPPG